MAFGKEIKTRKIALEDIPSYGSTASQMAANATRKKPKVIKRGKLYWTDLYKPNTITPDWIRLVPGEFVSARVREDGTIYNDITAWKEVIEHRYDVTGRSGICSGGIHINYKNTEPCHGCDIKNQDYEKRRSEGVKGFGPMSATPKFVFTCLDKGTYHNLVQMDKDGRPRLNNSGEPWRSWVRCLGSGCKHCQAGEETKRGHAAPWMLSKSHFETLWAYAADVLSGTCIVCNSKDAITVAMWQCGNPDCGDPIIDVGNTSLDAEGIAALTSQPYTCRRCGQTLYPEAVLECVNCTPQGVMPKRATLFDVDLRIRANKIGEGSQSALLISESSIAHPIEDRFLETLKYSPNLNRRFVPTPLDEQMKLWGIAKPRTYSPQPGIPQHIQNRMAGTQFTQPYSDSEPEPEQE